MEPLCSGRKRELVLAPKGLPVERRIGEVEFFFRKSQVVTLVHEEWQTKGHEETGGYRDPWAIGNDVEDYI